MNINLCPWKKVIVGLGKYLKIFPIECVDVQGKLFTGNKLKIKIAGEFVLVKYFVYSLFLKIKYFKLKAEA